MFVIGIGLTRHFQVYARGKGFQKSESTDPVMSSVWTLISRGRYGTLNTILAYSLFFVTTWLLLEKAMDLLLVWLTIDPARAWVSAAGPWEVFLWLSRAVFLFLVYYACSLPWRVKHKK